MPMNMYAYVGKMSYNLSSPVTCECVWARANVCMCGVGMRVCMHACVCVIFIRAASLID